MMSYYVAMRKGLLPSLTFALVFPLPEFAQPKEVRELTPGVDGNFPWGAREILPRIGATTSKPIRYVLNTHCHGDHAYGNSVFVDAGATIVSSEATADELGIKGPNSWNGWKDAEHPLTGARVEPARNLLK
jgi:glyoxylase-like metal-dependent hydrolase (beta-lactamase superfamily II)